jgi:hypothetical protein
MLARHQTFYICTFITGALIGMAAAYAWAV